MKHTQDRIGKLPKWAQGYIEQLETQVERLLERKQHEEQELADRTTGIEWGIGYRDGQPLPSAARVRFGPPSNQIIVRIDRDGGEIRLSATDRLVIKPSSSSSAIVSSEPY